jgi:hypothetical protein
VIRRTVYLLKMTVFWVDRRVGWYEFTTVSEVWTASIIGEKRPHRTDNGGSTDLWIGGKHIPVYTALQPRRQPPPQSPPWKSQVISLYLLLTRDSSSARSRMRTNLPSHRGVLPRCSSNVVCHTLASCIPVYVCVYTWYPFIISL